MIAQKKCGEDIEPEAKEPSLVNTDIASLVKTNIDGDTGVLHELELPREDGTDNPGHGGQCGLFETSIQVTL